MSELDELQVGAATPAPEATPAQKAAQLQPLTTAADAAPVIPPVQEGLDFNIPLSDSQKLLISRIQIKKLDLAKQKADRKSVV